MNTVQLDELVINLTNDVDVATARLRLATELRATWPGGTAVLGVTPPAPPPPSRAPEPARPAAAKAKPPAAKRAKTMSNPDYPAIAAVILEARAAGKPVATALVDRFGAPMSTVKNWMGKCRQLGLTDGDQSKPTGAPPPSPGRAAEPSSSERVIPGKVFRCSTCRDEFATVPLLIEHTLKDLRTPAPSARTHTGLTSRLR